MAPKTISLMNIEAYSISSVRAIALSGMFDESAIPELRAMSMDLVSGCEKECIVDFSGVVKMSNRVLNLFVDMSRELARIGGRLFLMNLNETQRERIEQIRDLCPNLILFTDEIEAQNYLAQQENLYCF